MTKAIRLAGNVVGIMGVLVCLAAGISRLIQKWYLAGFEISVLFDAGIGLMVLACFAKLWALDADRAKRPEARRDIQSQ